MALGGAMENGWPECDLSDCDYATIPGTPLRLPFRRGIPLAILQAFLRDLNQYVESANNSRGYSDEGSWTDNNSVYTSNHKGATAFDYNWDDHPMGVALAGWHGSDIIPGEQEPAVRELLKFYTYKGLQLVWWGNDWNSPKDSMHFQMGYNTANNTELCNEFIAKFIRPDGFSTFKRGDGSGVDAAQVLSDAMGGRLSLDRYRQLLPAVTASLQACDCTNVNRIAMWCAQIGHESAGLYYTEEIASGAAYEGRADLGNTQPGDGVRFKGRSWIQITGRSNYTRLSQWAFSKGLVPSATYFVDNPTALASDEYAGLGAAWYWVVARPDINALSDNRDLLTVTKRINGGTNGLDDRQTRYNRALAMGDQLLALTTQGDDFMSALNDQEQRQLFDRTNQVWGALFNPVGSLSKYKADGEGDIYKTKDVIRFIDKNVHEMLVERQAMAGNPEALALVKREADKGDKWAKVVYDYCVSAEPDA